MEDASTDRSLGRVTLAIGTAFATAVLVALLLNRPAHAALHRAALVVQHSSGRVITRCVGFVEQQITGLQLIQRSGVQFQAQTFGSIGTAICQLDNEPSPVPSNCFGSGPYWQYSHRTSTGWQPSAVASSTWQVHDGDMDGWRYAGGSAQTPPVIAFATVCAQPHASIAPTQQASSTAPVVRAAPSVVSKPTAASTTATPSASGQAFLPTPSPTEKAALGATGPSPPARSSPLGTWLMIVGAMALLGGLGVFTVLRRRP
jgi:hypothetical protein